MRPRRGVRFPSLLESIEMGSGKEILVNKPPTMEVRRIFWFVAQDNLTDRVVCLEINGELYEGRLNVVSDRHVHASDLITRYGTKKS